MLKFFAANRKPWHFRMTPDGGIGFCIWTLQQDGLRVPPFDRHPDGGGMLRTAGLTSDGWWEWFLAVITLNRQMDDFATARISPTREVAMPAYLSYQAWYKEPAVARALEALWKPYENETAARKERYARATTPWHLPPRDYRRWWKQLTAIRGGLPPLSVFVTQYPETVVYLSPPASLVIGTAIATLDHATYASLTLNGTAQLATAAQAAMP